MIEKNRINRLIGACLLILLAVFGVVLLLQLASVFYTPTRQTCSDRVCLKKFLDGPPAFNDNHMASYLQSNYFDAPSGDKMQMSNENTYEPDQFYYDTKAYINEYFQFRNRTGGRFVVLGAGDGEYRDYTIDLEREKGWTGLLVEANPILYKILKSKRRNAELTSACISPFSYPAKVTMKYPAFGPEITSDHDKLMRYRETKNAQLWTQEFAFEQFVGQCFPLTNIIYAANTISDKIDLLVLDMSGGDMDTLMSVHLESLPEIEMILAVAHGNDISNEISGFFLERNLVVTKAFGTEMANFRYILTKFKARTALVDQK